MVQCRCIEPHQFTPMDRQFTESKLDWFWKRAENESYEYH
jgi:hypothetical protein